MKLSTGQQFNRSQNDEREAKLTAAREVIRQANAEKVAERGLRKSGRLAKSAEKSAAKSLRETVKEIVSAGKAGSLLYILSNSGDFLLLMAEIRQDAAEAQTETITETVAA